MSLMSTVLYIQMVSQFIIDPMHTSDGGLLKHFITAYLGKPSQFVSQAALEAMDTLLNGELVFTDFLAFLRC